MEHLPSSGRNPVADCYKNATELSTKITETTGLLVRPLVFSIRTSMWYANTNPLKTVTSPNYT